MKTLAAAIICITIFTACSSTRVGLHSDGKRINYNIKMNINNR